MCLIRAHCSVRWCSVGKVLIPLSNNFIPLGIGCNILYLHDIHIRLQVSALFLSRVPAVVDGATPIQHSQKLLISNAISKGSILEISPFFLRLALNFYCILCWTDMQTVSMGFLLRLRDDVKLLHQFLLQRHTAEFVLFRA